MSDLFISYSRRDLAFVSALASALEDRQREVWVDLTAIPPTAEWLNEIYRGIEEADAFLFVLSPDSVASDMCRQELTHAISARKRLVPLLFRAVADDQVAPALQSLQWLTSEHDEAVQQIAERLIHVLDTNLEWSAQHTARLAMNQPTPAASRIKPLIVMMKTRLNASSKRA